jgi:hypothetical protein
MVTKPLNEMVGLDPEDGKITPTAKGSWMASDKRGCCIHVKMQQPWKSRVNNVELEAFKRAVGAAEPCSTQHF